MKRRMLLVLPPLFTAAVLCAAASTTAATLSLPQKSLPRQITKTTKLPAGSYVVPDTHDGTETPGTAGAALVVSGDNLTLDMSGVSLRGTPASVAPNTRRGVGILVTGRNVTIKNARVHGYKVGLIARNASGIKIIGGDFSDNWKQRLASTPEREDISDWMSFHHNEKNEWLRFGAAIYLDHCDRFSVTRTRANRGQCGLMLASSSHGTVAGCDFSFMSGIGIGLYRSSENNIQQNKMDWCVRGYSHGVYNRGQDSAGILVYEQSSRNIFAYNSVTHGGDGFFLWAGQTTMDTGKGGCNDNLVYGNDFSHSPTNGIEATFSRNLFVNNKVYECWHGVWGGYSFDNRFVGNHFGYNAEAIAIEHGQNNAIIGNRFYQDNAGIRLWENAKQDPDWAYPKHRDTRSYGYVITGNTIRTLLPNDYGVTKGIIEKANIFHSPISAATMKPSGAPILATEDHDYSNRFQTPDWKPFAPQTGGIAAPKKLPGYADAFLPQGTLRGRRYIFVDEWGPYDFRRPLMITREPLLTDGGAPREYDILGPAGTWRLKAASPGVKLSKSSGTVPDRVVVTLPPTSGKAVQVKVDLQHHNGKALTAFGISRFVAPIRWRVAFFGWDKNGSDPRMHPEKFSKLLTSSPLATLTTETLDFAGYGKFAANVPADYFATVAEGEFEVPPGSYFLDVTTDDGCRVTLDGKPILTGAWKYQGPTLYSIPFTSAGSAPHKLHVEHFQIDGYARLKVALRVNKVSR
jgi:parallel beta-helix repeat protein